MRRNRPCHYEVAKALVVLLVAFFLVPAVWAPVYAQAPTPGQPQSRAETLRRQREAKRRQLVPQEVGSMEKRMLGVENPEARNLMAANFLGFYPRAQFVSRGSGIGLGTRFWKPDVGNRPLDIAGSAFYTVNEYQYYDFQLGRVPHADNSLPLRSWKGDDVYELADTTLPGTRPLTFYLTLRYRSLPKEDYFGLGPGSLLGNHTSYGQKDAVAEFVVGYKLTPWLGVTGRSGFLSYRIRSGGDSSLPSIEEIFDESTAPGLTTQPDFAKVTGQIMIDFRDEPGNPQRGAVVALALSRYEDTGDDGFSFTRVALDARGFVPLGNPQRLLALRLRGFFDDPSAGGAVPFYLQESLGGSHSLRGFDSFRFRGEKVLLAQAEYRWLAAPPVELAIFYDIGTVAAPGRDLELDDLRSDWGVGLRIKNFRSTLARIEYARGNETSRFIVRVSSSF